MNVYDDIPGYWTITTNTYLLMKRNINPLTMELRNISYKLFDTFTQLLFDVSSIY